MAYTDMEGATLRETWEAALADIRAVEWEDILLDEEDWVPSAVINGWTIVDHPNDGRPALALVRIRPLDGDRGKGYSYVMVHLSTGPGLDDSDVYRMPWHLVNKVEVRDEGYEKAWRLKYGVYPKDYDPD